MATGSGFEPVFRHALKEFADSGIRVVDYASGWSQRLDSHLRRSILDGVRDIWQANHDRVGEAFGADGVELSAHGGCAPDHLPYQGRQFSKRQFEKLQGELERPIGFWNCRHIAFPIILGVSRPAHTEQELRQLEEMSTRRLDFEGKEYTAYEATQLQRKLETAMRQAKDRALLAKESGDDLGRRIEQTKLNQLKDKYVDVCQKFGLPYKSERMRVSGFRPVKSMSEISKEIIEKGYNPRNIMLDNKNVRKQYIESVSKIPELIDKKKSLKDQALQAFELRNTYRTNARNAMKDQEARAILDKARPNLSFEELLNHKMFDKGLSYEDALRDIIRSASTTNKKVDDLFPKD